ncbi:MAG TPA: DEAD/DEAH box helicase [Polyangiaceae bacterium]|nr:DEAD/DEAH box helicase [Polyangiaceae bacterium]
MPALRAPRVVSTRPAVRPSPLAPPAAPGRAPAGRAFALDVPFSMRALASAAGARWDDAHKVFVVRGERLPAELEPFRAPRYSWERKVEDDLNGGPAPGERAGAAPAGEGIALRPHQAAAVEAILASRAGGRPGFLLADDVGLGKTIAAWAALRRMRDVETVLVVCPLAVVAHWRRTIERMGDGGKRVVVINYDRLSKLFEVPPAARGRVRTKKGVARRGEAHPFDVVVWDESHRCKNPAAARSKLAAKLTAEAGFALWLSATAGQNPLELSYLAPLLASTTGSRASDLRDFERWCQAQGLGVERGAYGKWAWAGDARDLEAVRALLFDGRPPAGLRRRPEDIAGWPALNRILTPVGLEGEARALYERAWTSFRRELALSPRGRDPKGALAAMLRLRQKSSLIRAEGTVDLALELLENGHQVAISVAFRETLEAIAAGLAAAGHPSARVDGSLGAREREAERLSFQRGERRAVLFTVEEGISLHQGEHNEAPRSEVIHDLRWSAIQMAQIEGRCHRDGRFAQVYWAYADGTVEEQIAAVVCGRLKAMKGMNGDDVATVDEIAALLERACDAAP